MLRRLSADEQRSVRHWSMEFVVVVAGVLLALLLQDWGEHRRALNNLASAEDAIHEEVRASLENLMWRQAISQCHIDRARLLKSMLMVGGNQWPGLSENALIQNDLSQSTGVQTVMQGVYQRPFEPFRTAAWESALTTGALAPMDSQKFAKLTGIYALLQFMTETQEREYRAASTLSALSLPQELTPETRTTMLGALYDIDSTRFMFNYQGAPELAAQMKDVGWNDKAEIDRWIAADRAEQVKQAMKWRPCVKPERNPFN